MVFGFWLFFLNQNKTEVITFKDNLSHAFWQQRIGALCPPHTRKWRIHLKAASVSWRCDIVSPWKDADPEVRYSWYLWITFDNIIHTLRSIDSVFFYLSSTKMVPEWFRAPCGFLMWISPFRLLSFSSPYSFSFPTLAVVSSHLWRKDLTDLFFSLFSIGPPPASDISTL